MGWARYGSPNSNGISHHFLGNVTLNYGAIYFPKMIPIHSCMEVVVFPHVFGAPGRSDSCFLHFPVFFPHGWEVVLLTISGWDLC